MWLYTYADPVNWSDPGGLKAMVDWNFYEKAIKATHPNVDLIRDVGDPKDYRKVENAIELIINNFEGRVASTPVGTPTGDVVRYCDIPASKYRSAQTFNSFDWLFW
jgi:hypothetical protein